MNIELTQRELQMIVSALHIVAPSGGGSEPFHLAYKIQVATGVKPLIELEATYCANVLSEAEDCGAITIHKQQ